MKKIWTLITILAASVIYLTGCGGGGVVEGANGNNGDSPTPQPIPAILNLNVLDTGQSDSIYIKMPDGKDVLIDGGNSGTAINQLPHLMDKNDQEIDLVILTHPHSDHINGLLEVLDRYKVKEIWETGVGFISINYSKWKTKVRQLGIPDRKVRAGVEMWFGQAKLQVIAPTKSYDGVFMIEPNGSSIVCQLTYGSFKALLLADATILEQTEFADSLESQTFVKVAHHGAIDAVYEPLWRRIQPQASVLTVSTPSANWGLPSDEVQKMMAKYSQKNYRTDRDGIISAKSDGTNWSVSLHN